MVYVYTGDGKGKTTAAIGAGIRAIGAGKKVLMVQFLKVKELTSEYKIIQSLDGFDIESFGRAGFYVPKEYLDKNPEAKKYGVKPLSDIDYKFACDGIDFVYSKAKDEIYNLIILDEICVALSFGLIDTEVVLNLLSRYRDNVHFVLTGRNCPEEILDTADLITEMKDVKHYFRKGIKAVKGIDF